jgi:hypothetical protein
MIIFSIVHQLTDSFSVSMAGINIPVSVEIELFHLQPFKKFQEETREYYICKVFVMVTYSPHLAFWNPVAGFKVTKTHRFSIKLILLDVTNIMMDIFHCVNFKYLIYTSSDFYILILSIIIILKKILFFITLNFMASVEIECETIWKSD